jgi:hypothetical protein
VSWALEKCDEARRYRLQQVALEIYDFRTMLGTTPGKFAAAHGS